MEGEVEATGSAEVLEGLASEGLRPISLKVIKGLGQINKSLFGRSISVADKVFLTKYLALMLKVGTDLFKAIDILIIDLDKPAMRAFLTEVRSALEKGQPFYTTFLKYPRYFSPVFINMIKAGETSGNLERVLYDLSISLDKEQALRRSVKAALTYPIILVVASLGVLTLLMTFAVPKIAVVFNSITTKPPLFSRIVITGSLFLSHYLWFFLIGVVILGIAFWRFLKTVSGKKIFSRFINKVPVIKNVLKEIALQRFTSTLSSLLKSGMPILNSLEITAQAVGSEEVKNSLLRISREGISKGLTVGEAFRRETVFPRTVVNLMALSEKAGHMEDVLNTLADFYGTEVETAVKAMMTFLEPIMLLMIGVIIATIALSLIIPLYQIVGQI